MPTGAHKHLIPQTYALILAGGRGSRLHQLTDNRSKPALPFAGNLNLIDFTLSNCVNSGVRRIGVITQYKAQSLIRHIEHGWGFLSASLGEYVDVLPAQQQHGESWYSGTADAVFQNLTILDEAPTERVLILSGDHVYKMNFAIMLDEHMARDADLTIASMEVPLEDARAFGVMSVDADERIQSFTEKPAHPQAIPTRPDHALVSMGVYVFKIDLLKQALIRDAANPNSNHDFGRDIVPALLGQHKVYAHRFASSCVNMVGDKPYWRDVGTVDAYWEANMDLISVVPELNLYDDDWPILSLQRQLAPAKFVFDEPNRRGLAIDSVVCSGCIVSGASILRSILFSKVTVGEGSHVEDSVVLPNAQLGCGVRLRRAIVDTHCTLQDGFSAGINRDLDLARGFHITPRGVTLITQKMLGQASGEGG